MAERKIALVTGAAQGLGYADAVRLAEGGYRVVVTDVNGDGATAAAAQIGEGAFGWQLDVRDPAAVEEAFTRVDRELGRLDVLVNNAGISRPEATVDVGEDEWQRMIDIHLGGTFRCSKFAYPLLARQGGAIVNVASIAAILGYGKRASYAAAKGGISAMTRDLAMEWVGDGIRVNAVAPGVIETDILTENVERGMLDPSTFEKRIPMGRLGRPSELAETVFFLADTATYITGQTIVCDGG
ncbi:MAG: SDR family oxidoreductase, partial [Actinobacteria bacterium]|nr:SDR family oxidoreductase [Actinomycetota bacterium]